MARLRYERRSTRVADICKLGRTAARFWDQVENLSWAAAPGPRPTTGTTPAIMRYRRTSARLSCAIPQGGKVAMYPALVYAGYVSDAKPLGRIAGVRFSERQIWSQLGQVRRVHARVAARPTRIKLAITCWVWRES